MTPQQVKAKFVREGRSISEWAKKHGFPRQAVYALLGGRTRALRGQSHDIAVALGIKPRPDSTTQS